MARRNGESVVTTAAAISVYWKNLTASQRAVYFQLAANDKFRYYREKSEYENFLENQRKESQERQVEDVPPVMASNLDTKGDCEKLDAIGDMVPEDWRLPGVIVAPDGATRNCEDSVPPYSRQAIALLASKLDQASIDFIIKVLK